MKKYHFKGIAQKPLPKQFTRVSKETSTILEYDPKPMARLRKAIEDIHQLITNRYGRN